MNLSVRSASHPAWIRSLVVFLACWLGSAPLVAAERDEFTVAQRPAFIIPCPKANLREAATTDGKPWVWYAPTLGKGLPGAAEQWMLERLHAAGISLAGIDVGESYGSPAGRAAYQAFYKEMTEKRHFSTKPVLLARSRGGLMLLSWALEHPASVAGIAGIYPVCNLTSYPGIKRAAPAFGLTPEELTKQLPQHNPVDRLDELEKLAGFGVPIFHLQGDSDRVVPHEKNTALLAERYRERGGTMKIELIAGQGHNMWNGWFQSQPLTDFMIAKAHGWPDLELASPFVDHAILQRQAPVPVWGWGKPGEKVAVSFAGQTATAQVSEQGKWRVDLQPLTASAEGGTLRVVSGAETLECKDVLVGEVWLSSGQSNMDWIAGKSMCRDLAGKLQRERGAIPVREYNVDIGSSLFPASRADCKEGWKRSDKASNFSALSLAFAYELHEQLEVPVGIVRATHGATPIETWTAFEGFAAQEELQEIADRIRQSNPRTDASKQAMTEYFKQLRVWQQESEALMNRGGAALPRPPLPGIADDWKGPSRMHNRKIAPLAPFAIRGVIWCQGTSNANDGKIYAAKMHALVDGLRFHWKQPKLPFYFTQMQCYGEPDPKQVGFADIREAQTRFFLTAKHVGMVPQHDLNPANPGGIHYYNKLDPGKRLARWALAHQYGRDIAYTGPIYKSHQVENGAVRVQFEQRGPGGSLMVGSKGMEADAKQDPNGYVEPAIETPNEPLRQFRLAGKDKVWHEATATIDGESVVVRSDKVIEPVGIQYAYNNSPIGANLYNRAGLPALPFAYFDGQQMFNEDDPAIVAAAKAEAERRWGKRSYLQPATLFRNHAVLQREQPIPVWGHGVPGSTVTVEFGKQQRSTKVDEFERWHVTLEAMPANAKGQSLLIRCSTGESATIQDILVGDVWFLTGARQLASELIRAPKDNQVELPALPLVREFRIKTKARRFRTPRKMRMEIGGGRYLASWQPADFDDKGDPPSTAAYYFAAKAQQPNVPLGIVTLGAENPPITWVSHAAMQTTAGFERERDELNLAYPNTESCKNAVEDYIVTVKQYNATIASLLRAGKEVPAPLSNAAPAFPQPYYNQWASRTETPTHTYNFCISPLTPCAVRGVVWIPSQDNISSEPAKYLPSLKVFANSLEPTFGQGGIEFLFAHPAFLNELGKPQISGAKMVSFSEWPKSFRGLASQLGEQAAGK